LTDRELVRKARQDRDAFLVLYERYVDRVYGYLLVRTNKDQDAQDLTSETFLAALDSLDRRQPVTRFSAWLMGIAYHKLVDYYRSRPSALPLDEFDHLLNPHPSPEKYFTRQSDIDEIYEALSCLTEDRADAISLRFFGELSVAETARAMDRSRAAVKMLVMRGLRELRGHLKVAFPQEVKNEEPI
jgi:RNA polymerase sigma-70 factor (ECF subfamily)